MMKEGGSGHGRSGFTLVEIMIVVAIIAILAAIAIPQLIESRKMAKLNKCMNNLKLMEYAMEKAALNQGWTSGFNPTGAENDAWVAFVKDGAPDCPSGGSYTDPNVGEPGSASCDYHGSLSAPSALSALTSD